MTNKTHIAAGLSIAMAIAHPTSFKSLAICVTAATIGSIISDIDVTTSESHKDLVHIITISIIAIFLSSLMEICFNIGIVTYMLSQTTLCRILLGFMSFLLVCSYGMQKPHRTFMHSIPCVLILDIAVFIILPAAVFPFTIGILSHISLDLFNKKKIQLFYPNKFKFAFKVCPAQGKVNNRICAVASSLFLVEIGIFLAYFFIK